jgi:hypothetical protein
MKFPYKIYGEIPRPVIQIILKNGSKVVGYNVLVDSGADICLFDENVGTYLGLDIKKGKPKEVFGVGGKASIYYVHPITIEVGGWQYKIEAGFMPDVAGRVMPYGIVGQKGFFEFFKIIFDRTGEDVELKIKKEK